MNKSQLIKHSKTWDRSGVLMASLCLVHCLFLPSLLTLIPAGYGWFQNPLLEVSLLMTSVVIGTISFWTSYKKHQQKGPSLLGLLGIVLLLSSLIQESLLNSHAVHWQAPFSSFNPLVLIGGISLISGHLWNQYACHCFCDSHCSHHEHSKPHHAERTP